MQNKNWLVGLLVLFGIGLVGELSARAAFWFFPKLESQRRQLTDVTRSTRDYQNSSGQSYLNYIPNPFFERGGVRVHNAQGYRGEPIPLRRTPKKSRVLFLGGSTTYGWGVEEASQTYPAHVGRLLGNDVEIINAGAPWATSAEFLTHYLFKFRYFRPDVVVIMPSGNDAAGMIRPFYHPDYSNWRAPLSSAPALSPVGELLLKSRLLSIPVLALFRHAGVSFIKDDDLPPRAPWFPSTEKLDSLPSQDDAFFQNMRTLLGEIRRDGAQILLVRFQPNPKLGYQTSVVAWLAREERSLRQLATEYQLPLVENPASSISAGNWQDDCHLNAAGESERARYLAPFVKALISSPAKARADKD